MHGILFKSLKDHVSDAAGRDAWEAVRADAGLDDRVYLAVDSYDDAELTALVDAYAVYSDTPPEGVLVGLGQTAATNFMDTYGSTAVHETDSALDLVAQVEPLVHTVLRNRNEAMDPPKLVCSRDGDTVTIEYRSPRLLCELARGLVSGIGDYLDDPLRAVERACMHDGAAVCELVVTRAE